MTDRVHWESGCQIGLQSPLSSMREVSGPFLRLTMESQNRPYLAVLPAGHSSAAQELLKMKRGATGLAPSVLGSGKNRPQRNDFLDNRDEKFCKDTDCETQQAGS